MLPLKDTLVRYWKNASMLGGRISSQSPTEPWPQTSVRML